MHDAFDRVHRLTGNVVKPAVVAVTARGTSTKYYPCRVIVTSARETGTHGDYKLSRNELTILVAGLAIVPRGNEIITFAGKDRTITSVIDALESRALYECECR